MLGELQKFPFCIHRSRSISCIMELFALCDVIGLSVFGPLLMRLSGENTLFHITLHCPISTLVEVQALSMCCQIILGCIETFGAFIYPSCVPRLHSIHSDSIASVSFVDLIGSLRASI